MEEMLVNLNCVMFLLTYIYAVLRHIYVLIYCCTHFNFLILILNWCDLLWLKCGVLLELPFILFGEWQQIRFSSCRKLRSQPLFAEITSGLAGSPPPRSYTDEHCWCEIFIVQVPDYFPVSQSAVS